MGQLFRSEEMALCQLFLQNEGAYSSVAEMGELGLVEFRDLNPDMNSFQRKFVNEIRRCDEMERQLRFLESEIKREEVKIMDPEEVPEAPHPREMIDLEATFEKMDNELREVKHNAEALKRNHLELTELKHILLKTNVFFEERDAQRDGDQVVLLPEDANASAAGAGGPMHLGFVTGVILREKMAGFERMLWRVCRGNVFLRQAEIALPLEDPVTGDKVNKWVFIVFFQGEQLKTKVRRICEGYRARLYPCPETLAERQTMLEGVQTRLLDITNVLNQTEDHRHRMLVAAAGNVKTWFMKVCKIKAIYHTLNLFNIDVTNKCLIGECWVPTRVMHTIQSALRRGTERSGGTVPPILNRMETQEAPPTYNRTNKFTKGFQALVNAYGYAMYREVNPAPYTVITFPFLFAIMFGDAGHGLLVAIFAAWMVLAEKKLIKFKTGGEMWNIMFGGRYILLLMGLFSVYTGVIYNDIFSKSFNIFGSHWHVDPSRLDNSTQILGDITLNPNDTEYEQHPYPFGVDPVWALAKNKITFLNAYKMKISIIIGITHMLFGICLTMWNNFYYGRYLNIICEFIPKMIFMICLFVYLLFLVIFKWIAYSAHSDEIARQPSCAPSILILFIDMCLFKTETVPKGSECEAYMFGGQGSVQPVLVVLALLCIPWMLILKPVLLRNTSGTRFFAVMYGKPLPGEDMEHEIEEIYIHQAIHTIEFVLESISHTASYLRLWALSLAHAQLSEVLWTMVMHMGLNFQQWYGGVVLWAIFAFWAALTISILVVMEGLSAFLHTLRLHWVEFQSKFYAGSGYLFAPFSFKKILAAAESEDD